MPTKTIRTAGASGDSSLTPAPATTAAESPRRHGRVLLVVCLSLATVVSAVASLNVALPEIARDTHASQTQLSWIVDAYAIPTLQQDGVEADDMIATLVRRALEEKLSVVIVSADKDMLQLLRDGVIMYDTGRNLVYGPEETRARRQRTGQARGCTSRRAQAAVLLRAAATISL